MLPLQAATAMEGDLKRDIQTGGKENWEPDATNLPPNDLEDRAKDTRVEVALLNLRDVKRCTTLSRSTIYRLISTNQFPKPLAVSPNRRAWSAQAIYEWLASRG
jgi:predicted DNA-binding transcriptional regulator AlpA